MASEPATVASVVPTTGRTWRATAGGRSAGAPHVADQSYSDNSQPDHADDFRRFAGLQLNEQKHDENRDACCTPRDATHTR
jgi:hypothetical protein